MSIVMLSIITSTMAQSNTDQIIFSSKPFERITNAETEFNEGSTIYGRLILNQPIRNYCKTPDNYALSKFKKSDGYNQYIVFFVRPVEEDERTRSNYEIKLYINDKDLEKTTLDFDIAPTDSDVHSLFAENNTFLNELANTSSTYNFFGNKAEFIVKLKDKLLGELSYDYDMAEPTGHLVINLANADYRTQNTWKETIEGNFKSIWKLYFN